MGHALDFVPMPLAFLKVMSLVPFSTSSTERPVKHSGSMLYLFANEAMFHYISSSSCGMQAQLLVGQSPGLAAEVT